MVKSLKVRWDPDTPYVFCLELLPGLHRFPRLGIEMSSGGKEAATPR